MARYARKLTKEELIEGGITNITEDGRVWKNGIEILEFPLNPSGYKWFWIYDRDENGRCIKVPRKLKNGTMSYTYKQRPITVNRAVLAWFNGIVEDGLVSDHIDNNRDNYDISNLQPITPGQNIGKERDNWNIKQIKCKLNKPRSFYSDKLEQYLAAYEKAKEEHNTEEAHKLRCNISQTRGRLRYWDEHKEEAEKEYRYTRALEMIQNLKKRAKFLNEMEIWRIYCDYEKKIKAQKYIDEEGFWSLTQAHLIEFNFIYSNI